MDTLKSAAMLNDSVVMPGWIGEPPIEDVRQLVPMGNGLLYVPERRLLRPTPQFWSLSRPLGFAYDPDAVCPRWDLFLDQIWPGDGEVHEVVQEMFGLFLTDVTRCQKMFSFVGPPRGGRGTIGRVLKGLLGSENVAGASFASFAGRFGLEGMVGKKLAVFGDATMDGVNRKEKVTVTERLKMITGEDDIPVERKGIPDLNIQLPIRIVTFSNQPLEYLDHSGAILTRIVSVEMRQSFAKNPDRQLTDKLLAERPGIFNWALEGLDRLRNREWQFRQPESGQGLAERTAMLSSSVRAFVEMKCAEWDGDKATRVGRLFAVYRTWCDSQNIWPGTLEQFSSNLQAVTGKHVGRPRTVEGENAPPSGRPTAIYGLRLLSQK